MPDISTISQLPSESNADYFYRKIALRQQHNEAWVTGATIDISSNNTGSERPGERKMSINPVTVNAIAGHLKLHKDFALIGDKDRYVYFIDGKPMISWCEKDHSNDSTTYFDDPVKFESALKMVLLVHQ